MSNHLITKAFNAGELSPRLYGRVDLAKYQSGMKEITNFILDIRGGMRSREGYVFLGELPNTGSAPPRLIPFIFNITTNNVLQQYVLVLVNQRMYFIYDDGLILENEKIITAFTATTQLVLNVASHGYVAGDLLYITGSNAYLNKRFVQVSGTTTSTVTVRQVEGSAITSASNIGAWTSDLRIARVYSIATPWSSEDLKLIRYAQSRDVMTLTCPGYARRDLIRNDQTDWVIETVTIGPIINTPTGINVTHNHPNPSPYYQPSNLTEFYSYIVTALTDAGDESAPSAPATSEGAPLNQNHGYRNKIKWNTVTDADRYFIYKANPVGKTAVPDGALHGYIGQSTGDTFYDTNIAPDYANTPPKFFDPFADDNYPTANTYYQGRHLFGGLNNNPLGIEGSKPENFKNFDYSVVSKADDALSFTLRDTQGNEIMHLFGRDTLLVFTSGNIWRVSSGSSTNNVLTPSSINALPIFGEGSSYLRPLLIGDDILYMNTNQEDVRALTLNQYVDTYKPISLGDLSDHLFEGYKIIDWFWSQNERVLYAIRDDGAMLTLTYVKDQDIYGWSRQVTNGKFVAFTQIFGQNGNERNYVITERYINNKKRFFIERMQERFFLYHDRLPADSSLVYSLDCGAYTPKIYPNVPLLINEDNNELRTIGNYFLSSHVGHRVHALGGIYDITAVTDYIATVTIVKPATCTNNICAAQRWLHTGSITSVNGLYFLAGQTVQVFADGGLKFEIVVPESGVIEFEDPLYHVAIGLPFTYQATTLNIDAGEPTIQAKRIRINNTFIRCLNSYGIFVSWNNGEFVEAKERDEYDDPDYGVILSNGDVAVAPKGGWTNKTNLTIKGQSPFPVEISAIVFDITGGDN